MNDATGGYCRGSRAKGICCYNRRLLTIVAAVMAEPSLASQTVPFLTDDTHQANPLWLFIALLVFALVTLLIAFYRQRSAYLASHSGLAASSPTISKKSMTPSYSHALLAELCSEVREPINGLVSGVDMLRHTRLEYQQQDMLEMIGGSTRKLQRLVHDMHDYAVLESGDLSLDQQSLDMVCVLRGLQKQLRETFSAKDIDLLTFCAPSMPEVMCDKERFQQMLYHLLWAISRKDLLRVFIGIEPTRIERESVALSCTIEVTGCDESRNFKLFFLDNILQNISLAAFEHDLGLHICRRLIEIMKGRITIDSLHNQQGFRIRIAMTLPRSGRQGRVWKDELAGLYVLQIMGEKNSAQIVQNYLKQAGAEVEQASPEKALARLLLLASEKKKLLVVVDDEMCDVNHADLFQTLSRTSTEHRPRFIRISHGYSVYPCHLGDEGLEINLNMLCFSSLIQTVNKLWETESHPDIAPERVPVGLNDSVMNQRASLIGNPVLLLEKSQISQSVLAQQLMMLGYGVELVEEAELAVQKWKDGGYSFLLLSWRMAANDPSLLSFIRLSQQQGAHSPVIAIIENGCKETSQQCLDAGVDDVLCKPFQLTQLAAILKNWVPGENYRPIHDEACLETTQNDGVPVIEPSALLQILGFEDDSKLVNHYIRFIERTSGAIKRLELAYQDDDVPEVARLCLQLKSSARTVGASALANRCAALERASKKGNSQVVRASIPLLIKELDDIAEWLELYQARELLPN